MKNIDKRLFSIINNAVSILTVALFMIWIMKQPQIISMGKFIGICVIAYSIAYFSSYLMSPIKCLVDYFTWKVKGYRQTYFPVFPFIRHNGIISATTNPYIINELFFPNTFFDTQHGNNIADLRRIETIKYYILAVVYLCAAVFLYVKFTMPWFIVPIAGFVLDLANANLESDLFCGSFAKLRQRDLFDYYIIRQDSIYQANRREIISRLIKMEENHYE